MLQGHIAIDQAVFPERTPGFVLDALARIPLWKIGLDYRHGNLLVNSYHDLLCLVSAPYKNTAWHCMNSLRSF